MTKDYLVRMSSQLDVLPLLLIGTRNYWSERIFQPPRKASHFVSSKPISLSRFCWRWWQVPSVPAPTNSFYKISNQYLWHGKPKAQKESKMNNQGRPSPQTCSVHQSGGCQWSQYCLRRRWNASTARRSCSWGKEWMRFHSICRVRTLQTSLERDSTKCWWTKMQTRWMQMRWSKLEIWW